MNLGLSYFLLHLAFISDMVPRVSIQAEETINLLKSKYQLDSLGFGGFEFEVQFRMFFGITKICIDVFMGTNWPNHIIKSVRV
jgi:hypothetical protein